MSGAGGEGNPTFAVTAPFEMERATTKLWFEEWNLEDFDSDDSEDSETAAEENELGEGEAGPGWKRSDVDRLGELGGLLWEKKMEELEEVYRKRMMRSGADEEKGLDKSDSCVKQAIQFRKNWTSNWKGVYGSFEDITRILPMSFTYDPAPPFARLCNTLQIFAVKVAGTEGGRGLQWPLHVFGMVAVRDSVDQNRNLVFYRRRDNCQTLTKMDPYLVLTGPTRAIVAVNEVNIEVDLKVKGAVESEDKYLSFQAMPLPRCSRDYEAEFGHGFYTFMCTSKHCTLELSLGEIPSSVEATIFVRVTGGSWPDGFHGQFVACTARAPHNEVLLLDFGGDKVPIKGDGYMNLDRRVVSVSYTELLELQVSFKAWQDDNKVVRGEVWFTPEIAGRSYGTLHLNSCVMEVLVVWSLVSPEPELPDY